MAKVIVSVLSHKTEDEVYAVRLFKCIVMVLMLCVAVPVFSYSDQLTTERILRENKLFLDFMNVCISNYAEDTRDEFRDIYQIHFNADIAYLQSDYWRAYKNVYRSQKKQADLYVKIAENHYLENAKNILDRLAPDIIKSKNSSARLYLTLAYRDRTVAKNYIAVGKASHPRLHSYRIYKYLDAVKMSRRAKRYGFLALFESQTIEKKKQIYNHLFEIEREKGNEFFLRFLSKDEDGYIEEMNKKYYDYKPETPVEGQENAGTDTYMRTLQKKVRFKNEKRVAEYLLYGEFDKAEPIIRKYVDQFNYMKIMATIENLAAANQGTLAGFDAETLKRTHADNYGRIYGKSMLDTFYSDVTVVDDIRDEKKQDTEETTDEAVDTKEPEDGEQNQ